MVDRRTFASGARQIGGQPIIKFGVHQLSHLPIHQISQIGDGVFHAVHGHGDMPTVEMPAMENMFAFAIDNGIVVGAVQFIFNKATHPGQTVLQHTNNMRSATYRVTIL